MIRCALTAALAGALVLAGLAPAQASVRSLRPAAVDGRALVFDLRALERGGTRIGRARLSIRSTRRGRPAGRRHIAVSLARVRKAAGRGRLRVLAPRRSSAAARRQARLVLVVSRARRATDGPAAGSAGAGPGFCPLGVLTRGTWPGSCWRPYGAASPFNVPVPAGAPLHPRSAQIVARVVALGQPDNLIAGTADTGRDWSHPTYYSQPTDPLYTLRCTASWGTCPLEGMRIRVPSAARPAGGSDAHMTIVDQAAGWEYPLYGVQSKPAGGGTLSFKWTHGRLRIDGTGTHGGATAAHFGNLAGIIRAQELAAGRIEHALFMVIRCDAGRHVFPARGSGSACSSTTDAPPMGARFQLDMTAAQIDALAVPPWKKAILRAMATYGAYFGDTGGNAWSVQLESGSTYTSFGYEDEMVAFARANGLPEHDGDHVLNLRDGVDWGRHLRVIAPCATEGSCAASNPRDGD